MVLVQVPLAPTTTLTAVAAPRNAPGMNDSGRNLGLNHHHKRGHTDER